MHARKHGSVLQHGSGLSRQRATGAAAIQIDAREVGTGEVDAVEAGACEAGAAEHAARQRHAREVVVAHLHTRDRRGCGKPDLGATAPRAADEFGASQAHGAGLTRPRPRRGQQGVREIGAAQRTQVQAGLSHVETGERADLLADTGNDAVPVLLVRGQEGPVQGPRGAEHAHDRQDHRRQHATAF